jgi:virulence factor Mce-like protein
VNKAAPSFGRIAAMVLFALSCFGLLLFLWLAFGGPVPLKPQGYRFKTTFGEATQLATEADVRISGVPVGKVKTITPDKATGRSTVEIELQTRYAPLPSDARAILRQKTLLGETYVELTPGSAAAEPIPEDGTLPASAVSETVELDEIVRAFDAPTRRAFQIWMQTQAEALAGGRGRAVNDALGNLGPFAEDAGELVTVLERQQGALQALVRDTGTVFEALTERQGQLRGLIANADRVFAATAARDDELQQIFRALPTFEREARATLERLSEFARETDPLVDQLRPAARALSPTLRDLSAISPDLKTLFTGLGPLISASRTGFPALERVLDDLRPVTAQLDPAMRQLVPVLDFVGLHRRELTAFLANAAGATQASDLQPTGRVHYLRTTNPLNPENLAVYPQRVGSNRTNPYVLPGGFDVLRSGGALDSFELRQCGRGNPLISEEAKGFPGPISEALGTAVATTRPITTLTATFDPVLGILGDQGFLRQVEQYAFRLDASGRVPAPACREQTPFASGTKFPPVREAAAP